MLDKFKRGYTSDYSVELTLQKLWKFCQINWVSFKVGWPSEGSLHQETICRVYQVVTGMPGHPDQFPYKGIWQTLAACSLPLLKKCFKDNYRIMMARATNTGTIKRKEREKRLLPHCSRCSSAWRSGDKSSRHPTLAIGSYPQWDKWCVRLCPDSFSKRWTCKAPKWSRRPRQFT
jgi:hypothetical protein